MNHGFGCWSLVPIHAGLQRSGKSCRLRWINYLRPGLKRETFTLHEGDIILTHHGMLGNKWWSYLMKVDKQTGLSLESSEADGFRKSPKFERPITSFDGRKSLLLWLS